MKLLFCEECGDIVAPHRVARNPRRCECQRHAVWWEDPRAGTLRLNDAAVPDSYHAYPVYTYSLKR